MILDLLVLVLRRVLPELLVIKVLPEHRVLVVFLALLAQQVSVDYLDP